MVRNLFFEIFGLKFENGKILKGKGNSREVMKGVKEEELHMHLIIIEYC